MDRSSRTESEWEEMGFYKARAQLVDPYVWFGNKTFASYWGKLDEHEITRVLTVGDEPLRHNWQKREGVVYKWVRIINNILPYLPECIKFIDEAQTNKKCIVVHCDDEKNGCTSAAVIYAFVMQKYRKSLDEVKDYYSQREKSLVKANLSAEFHDQLLVYHEVNFRIDGNNEALRLYMFTHFLQCLRTVVNPGFFNYTSSDEFLLVLKHYFTKMEAVERVVPVNSGREFVCTRCNNKLFDEINIIRNDRLNPIHPCENVFIEPQELLLTLMRTSPFLNLTGRLYCLDCRRKVGEYNLVSQEFGCQCEMHAPFIVPQLPDQGYKRSCMVFKIERDKFKARQVMPVVSSPPLVNYYCCS